MQTGHLLPKPHLTNLIITLAVITEKTIFDTPTCKTISACKMLILSIEKI